MYIVLHVSIMTILYIMYYFVHLQLTLDRKSGRKKNSGVSSFTSELVPLYILAAVAGRDKN